MKKIGWVRSILGINHDDNDSIMCHYFFIGKKKYAESMCGEFGLSLVNIDKIKRDEDIDNLNNCHKCKKELTK